LYLFLANFISLIYWLVCVYEYHVVLAQATANAYPIKPLRAAWFHLIPIYGLYWVFKWPRELARFVNSRLEAPLMKPDRTGLAVFIAFVVFLVLDRGLGMILLFWRHRICRVAFALRWRCGQQRPRGTAFFVNIRSEESKCKEGYAGSYHFA